MSTDTSSAEAVVGGPVLPVLAPEDLPNYDSFVTEDDTPVDSLFAEKQQQLLKDPLVNSWEGPGKGRPFLSFVNVGLFYAVDQPPLVPDFMLALDVLAPVDLHLKQNRSYFTWVFGKAPNVALEIVSERQAGEGDTKLNAYARLGIPYYVIFDPLNRLGPETLRAFGLIQGTYQPVSSNWLPEAHLGLILWHGTYEGCEELWLRWCDQAGQPLPTGRERTEAMERLLEQERRRADEERRRADEERRRADEERRRAEKLTQRLRDLGVEP